MANQRQLLLHSIATIIADYRQGEIPAIDANHVDRWVRQFGEFGFNNEAQVIILNEMERILNTYYISYKKAQAFISKALTSQNLFGANPAEAIINFQFLQIQTRGSSPEALNPAIKLHILSDKRLWQQIVAPMDDRATTI